MALISSVRTEVKYALESKNHTFYQVLVNLQLFIQSLRPVLFSMLISIIKCISYLGQCNIMDRY